MHREQLEHIIRAAAGITGSFIDTPYGHCYGFFS